MRLKSKVLALPVDSSSPMVLVVETSTNSRSSTSQGMNVAMSNNGTNVTLPTHATVTPTVTGLNIASNVPTTPHTFYASPRTLHDLTTGAWNMDTGASSRLNNFVTSLSTVLNSCMYLTVSVGDAYFIPVTNTGHNIDFMTRRLLLRCDSTRDLYPVMAPSPIPSAFLISQQTWHQRLGHPGSEVLRRLVSNNFISCNNEKPPTPAHVNSQSTSAQSTPNITHPAIIPDPPVNPNPTSVHSMVTRFRVGSNEPTQRLKFHVSSVSPLPKTYHDAFHDSNWQNAMRDEYDALIKNSTWTLVPRPSDTNIVRCMWLFRHRFLADDTLSLYKARLMENGSTQLEGVDVDETFIPVVKPRTIRIGYCLLLYVDDIVLTTSSSELFIFISAKEILEKAHMLNCNSSRTPIDTESKLGVGGDSVSDPTLYWSLADLVAYSDADWARCPTTRRSTSGYCVFLGNNLLSWSSNRQPMLSHSSAEAEYRGVANVVVETCLLRNLLHMAITKAGIKLLLHRAQFSCFWDTLGISTLKASVADA
ncbi:ribonuclease H-like domain-containing protein [Tanacetum coccineum]